VLAYRGRVRTDPTMTGFLPRLSALLLLLCLAPAPPACAIGKSTAAAPPAAPECGDPGRVPVPPRRPPIA